MEHKVKRLKTSTSIFRVKSSVPYIRFFCTSTSTTTMYLWQIVEIFYYLPEVHSSSSSRSTKNIRNFMYFYYYYYHVPLVVSRNFLLSTRGTWQYQQQKYKRTLCNEPSLSLVAQNQNHYFGLLLVPTARYRFNLDHLDIFKSIHKGFFSKTHVFLGQF